NHESERNHITNGVELTEALEESDVERAAFAEEFADENGDAEAETEDETSETETLSDEGGGNREIDARAEVRAPATTAGFQQRTERQGWGERRRGRRMGGRFRSREPRRALPAITDLLKEGQEILVQT